MGLYEQAQLWRALKNSDSIFREECMKWAEAQLPTSTKGILIAFVDILQASTDHEIADGCGEIQRETRPIEPFIDDDVLMLGFLYIHFSRGAFSDETMWKLANERTDLAEFFDSGRYEEYTGGTTRILSTDAPLDEQTKTIFAPLAVLAEERLRRYLPNISIVKNEVPETSPNQR
jgi:hypothetical protein